MDTSPEALLELAAALAREVGNGTLPLTDGVIAAIAGLNAVAAEKAGQAPVGRDFP